MSAHGTRFLAFHILGEGSGLDYQAWIQEKWATWLAANGYPPEAILTPDMHDAFDAWLATLTAMGAA